MTLKYNCILPILNPYLCCGSPRGRSLHKALHFSKRYCDCSNHHERKTENEENMPTRKVAKSK